MKPRLRVSKTKLGSMADSSSKLLGEIHKFLDECESDENNLSDTWRKTLDLKGSRYSVGEMLCMRKPGSNVSLQIVSFHQLSDAQALDLGNPIQRALVEMGDSEIGEPVLDLNVLGVNISSHYVNSIVTASKIITHLDSIGISEPTIMEIGSGIGLLGVALKKWYGSKVTLIFSDLPETLEHQSFLLLSTFPSEKYSFKPSTKNVEIAAGGINFVNTYKLASQNYPIDVFINCNSMAEMKAETANAYISYAKNNLNTEGIMYLSNAFGMATGSARTPAEYLFGDGLRVEDLDFADGYVYGGPTLVFMNALLARSEIARGIELRVSQREEYNRFVFLLGSNKSVKNSPIQDALKQLNQRSVLDVETSQINQLASTAGCNWPQLGGVTIRRFQIAIASAMDTSPQKSSEESKEFINEAVNDFSEMFQNKRAYLSEFHNLFFSAALTGLNRNEQASSWIKDHYQATRSSYWLARYAWVAEACGDRDLSTEILNGIDLTAMSRSWLPMVANLRFRLGQTDTANSLLSSIENTGFIDLALEELKVLYRANCLIGNRESSFRLYEKIKDSMRSNKIADSELGNNQLMDLICFGVENFRDGIIYFEKEFDSLESNFPAIGRMKPLRQFGRNKEAISIGHSLEIRFKKDYFSLAKLTENYLYVGDFLSAQRCASNSKILRPDNAKHLKYLGLAFFTFGDYESAGKCFSELVRNCGEDFVARGYEAFCKLSAENKVSGIFGAAETIHLMFQPDQTFYYPFGPRPR